MKTCIKSRSTLGRVSSAAAQKKAVAARGRRHQAICARLAHPHSAPQQSAPNREALLLERFKGHTAAVTAVLVTSDAEQSKEFITSSLDKSVALWNLPLTSADGEADERQATAEKVRLQPKGAPIFSLAEEPPSLDSARRQIFCGNASKSIDTWELPHPHFEDKVVLNGHTGWVRALATNRRYLFSSGCNKISQWDLARSVPRKVNEISVYTGDIQGLVTGGGRLFSCGADGSIRSWQVGKKGELTPGAARDKAHKERISAILYKSGFLYSVSLDGSVKMWDAATLELIQCCQGAHDGGKVHCGAVGPDGRLYTGGEDKLVRRWQLGELTPSPGGSAIYGHNYPVRARRMGRRGAGENRCPWGFKTQSRRAANLETWKETSGSPGGLQGGRLVCPPHWNGWRVIFRVLF
jgi:pleiotropic regulator 1